MVGEGNGEFLKRGVRRVWVCAFSLIFEEKKLNFFENPNLVNISLHPL